VIDYDEKKSFVFQEVFVTVMCDMISFVVYAGLLYCVCYIFFNVYAVYADGSVSPKVNFLYKYTLLIK